MPPTASPVTCIVGVGPGLGASVARRFARAGHAVALVARSPDPLAAVAAEVEAAGGRAVGVEADATSRPSVQAAAARVREALGDPEVLVYNAGAFRMGGVLELDPEEVVRSWETNCLGALLWAQSVLPAMLERRRGTILLTGATASLRGSARFAALAVGKFGLRALGQSLARELGPRGVHVAHVVVDGQIDTPRVRGMYPGREAATMLDPDAIADTYFALYAQDPTAWTQEIDLRPAVEKF